MLEMEPAKCSLCHGEPFDPKNLHTPGLKGAYHRLCMDCHQEADQTPHQRGPVMYSSMVRGPEVRPLDTQAPTDCLACHARKVPDHKTWSSSRARWTPWRDPKLPFLPRQGGPGHFKDLPLELAGRLRHLRWDMKNAMIWASAHATINNFCINLNGNWPRCTSCHIGYGWKDANFDFKDPGKIDCLVCHDTTGTYKKIPTGAGFPKKDVDLLKVAQERGASLPVHLRHELPLSSAAAVTRSSTAT
jgi:hypothetical protein